MSGIHEKRIENVRKKMADADIDTFLVQVGENRRYLSGFTGSDGQFDETAGVLVVTDDRLLLVTDGRYRLQAEDEAPLFEVRQVEKGVDKELPDIFGMLDSRRVGFESVRMSVRTHGRITAEIEAGGWSAVLVPTTDIVESLRIVKDEEEIGVIRRALAIAESVFESACAMAVPGATEAGIAWQMEIGMREAGAEGLAFDTIVAAGPNSANPHAVPGDRRLAEGMPLLFDWGARLAGYCSDISRTVPVGRPDDRFREIRGIVKEAQEAGIAAIRPGVPAREVDAAARKRIEQAGYGDRFNHSLGHGVGLAIHEAPRLSRLTDRLLEEGMVITVEPGIYLPDWGGVRLENLIVVREDGAEVLNRLPVAPA